MVPGSLWLLLHGMQYVSCACFYMLPAITMLLNGTCYLYLRLMHCSCVLSTTARACGPVRVCQTPVRSVRVCQKPDLPASPYSSFISLLVMILI